jgi:hypothetical protein
VEKCWFWCCVEELSGSENHPNGRNHETTSPENRFRRVRGLLSVDRGGVGIEGI